MEAKLKQLGDRIEQLTFALDEAKCEERRSAIATRVIAAVMALIIGIFLVVNYAQIKTEWTKENLRASLERELNELNPAASAELGELARYLAPVYSAETKKQLTELGPTLAKAFIAQAEGLAGELREDALDRLREMDGRIRDRTMSAVAMTYPELMNPEEQIRLAQRFEIITEDALLGALTDFDNRFSKDAHELHNDLMSFDLRDTDESTPDLQKKFIRLWLKLLDLEIAKI